MANTYITRTPASNGNQKTWTFSAWIKNNGKSGDGTYQYLMEAYYGNSTRYSYVCLRQGTIECYGGDYSTSSTSLSFDVTTNRRLRDPSAWYHVVVAFDSTQATNTNRLKVYINGEQETSFQGYVGGGSLTWPDQNDDTFFNVTTTLNRIGKEFDGSMAHVHFVDGTAYPASTFGETDSTSGIWKPKTSPSVTYGTNGFFLKFENSGNLDLDSGSNNLTFATTGTLTQNTDTPTNNACIINGVSNEASGFTFANANTSATFASGSWKTIQGTLGAKKGKWYYETKWNGTGSYMAGWTSVDFMNKSPVNYVGHTHTEPSYAIQAGDGGVYYSTSSLHSQDSASWGDTFGSSNVLGCAIDIDNGKLYWSKDGVWMNSGVPTSGSTGTGAFNIADTATNYFWQPVMSSYNSAQGMFNFVSGYFGTTQVSSANADANGHGAFEYAVPSGYYALNTKNLKEFG